MVYVVLVAGVTLRLPGPAAPKDWTTPSDHLTVKGGAPVRSNETVAASPAQTVPPPATVAEGGRETGIAREALALHVPAVATTATVTGSVEPVNVMALVPWPDWIEPFVTVQA
jgi:hypothetical protein